MLNNLDFLWKQDIEEYRSLFLDDDLLKEEIYGNIEKDPKKIKIKNIRKGSKRKYETNYKRGL